MASFACAKQLESDDELLKRTRDGDQSEFGELIQRHHTTCIHRASEMLRDRDRTKDEAQKAYWKPYSDLDQYRGDGSIPPWLLRITKADCLILLRVKRRVHPLKVDDGPEAREGVELRATGSDAEHTAIDNELIAMLRKEVRLLPPLMRNVIMLRYVQELTMEEVAQQLVITVPAAKSCLLRARLELRKRVIARWSAHTIQIEKLGSTP